MTNVTFLTKSKSYMYKLIILSVLLIAFQTNSLCQTLHKDSIKTDYIEFGKGGGFSGASKNYLLTQTGDLYSLPNILTDPNALVYLKKIKTSTTKQVFNYAKKKKLTELTYNKPGNLFHYMTLSINNKKKNLVWESSDSATPLTITTLSTKLYNLL
jgi:hypothetical protein